MEANSGRPERQRPICDQQAAAALIGDSIPLPGPLAILAILGPNYMSHLAK